MHYSCMATKTITLELDAYEKLRRAKRRPSESFSQVVRRAVFPEQPLTGAELAAQGRALMRDGKHVLEEAALDRLDAAQRAARRSDSEW
jgi:hypothetical protein